MMIKPSTLIMLLLAPFLEIYLIIKVGSYLGGMMAIFLVVFTSVLGYLLIKYQSSNTLAHVQQSIMRGEVPKKSMTEAAVVMFAGILLMIPGFITDTMGLLMLVPGFRQIMARRLLAQAIQRTSSAFSAAAAAAEEKAESMSGFATGPAANEEISTSIDSDSDSGNHQTIEGEYKRED